MVCLSGDKVTICLRLRAKIVSGLERKKGGRANHHRPENLLADIKVVVREAAPLISQNAMVRVLGRELGNPATECGTLLHALEDEVDSIRILFHHPAQMRQTLVFLCARPSRPIGWESCDCGISFHPLLVVASALREDGLVHYRRSDHLTEEIHHLIWPRQSAQVAADEDAVEAVVYKYKQAAKQLCERLHRSSSFDRVLTTRSSVRRPVESKFQICLARISSRVMFQRKGDLLVEYSSNSGVQWLAKK